MKIRIIAAAAFAAVSLQAHALDISTTNAASTVKVYAAGASAPSNILAGMFVQNCAAGTLDIYGSKAGSAAASSDTNNGDSYRVYSCTLKANDQLDSDLRGLNLGGRNVAMWKRDAGGSANGVFPVPLSRGATPAVQTLGQLLVDSTSCTSTGQAASFTTANSRPVFSYTCTTIDPTQRPVELGFSDAEPQLFKGMNVPDTLATTYGSGLNAGELAQLTITPTFQTVFAVAVTKSLYDELVAQGQVSASGKASVNSLAIGSLLRGELADPAGGFGWQSLGVVNAADTQVTICRRTPGSGTQAAANLKFSMYPLANPAWPVPARAADSSVDSLVVTEGGSTGNVRDCLTAQNNNAAAPYAIGHVSLENAETAAWKFVALDGVDPSRDNAKLGRYDYVLESSAQYRTAYVNGLAASASADDKAKANFIKGFVKAVGRPANLAKLPTATQNGVVALPSQGTFGGAGADGTFVSRVSRTNGKNTTPLAIVN